MTSRISLRALAATLFLLASSTARASGYLDAWHPNQTYWAAGWEVGIPVQTLRSNWVNAPSWLGGTFEVRVGVVSRLALGVAGSWNWFDQNFSQVSIQYSDYTFTGPVYRRLSAFTLRGTAHYYLTSSAVQPFIGVGVGGVWTATRRQTADREETAYSSYFAVDPEVGILFSATSDFALYVLGRYQWTAASFYGVQDAQWVGVQVGVAFLY